MKLLKVEVENFASYLNLVFNFDQTGLSLVYGPTGSGKSTLQDMTCWILFGITAKNGNVDDIRSWTNPDEITYGDIVLQLSDGSQFEVIRIRGKSYNDLFYNLNNSEGVRGKNLNDTQRLIEQKLGVSAEQFLAGSYFNESSEASKFFDNSAKGRRQLLNLVTDLSLPNKLSENSTKKRKVLKQDISIAQQALTKVQGMLESLLRSKEDAGMRHSDWTDAHNELLFELQLKHKGFEVQKESKIKELQTKRDAFETNRAKDIDVKLTRLSKAYEKDYFCSECDQLLPTDAAQNAIQTIELQILYLKSQENPYVIQLEQAKLLENHYLARIQEEKKKVNPFTAQLNKLSIDIQGNTGSLEAALLNVETLEADFDKYLRLHDLSLDLRRELLKTNISQLEKQTNDYLSKFFDSEFSISLTLDDTGDSLDLNIKKNGYDCVYKQLSKGQKGLLKLCFVVSVMSAVSNNCGVHFNTLFFDEALDGLDPDLKVKAYALFEELSKTHDNVLVIEHSTEFKSMFSNQYQVVMEGDTSTVNLV